LHPPGRGQRPPPPQPKTPWVVPQKKEKWSRPNKGGVFGQQPLKNPPTKAKNNKNRLTENTQERTKNPKGTTEKKKEHTDPPLRKSTLGHKTNQPARGGKIGVWEKQRWKKKKTQTGEGARAKKNKKKHLGRFGPGGLPTPKKPKKWELFPTQRGGEETFSLGKKQKQTKNDYEGKKKRKKKKKKRGV